jgi:hypothetical protein
VTGYHSWQAGLAEGLVADSVVLEASQAHLLAAVWWRIWIRPVSGWLTVYPHIVLVYEP